MKISIIICKRRHIVVSTDNAIFFIDSNSLFAKTHKFNNKPILLYSFVEQQCCMKPIIDFAISEVCNISEAHRPFLACRGSGTLLRGLSLQTSAGDDDLSSATQSPTARRDCDYAGTDVEALRRKIFLTRTMRRTHSRTESWTLLREGSC